MVDHGNGKREKWAPAVYPYRAQTVPVLTTWVRAVFSQHHYSEVCSCVPFGHCAKKTQLVIDRKLLVFYQFILVWLEFQWLIGSHLPAICNAHIKRIHEQRVLFDISCAHDNGYDDAELCCLMYLTLFCVHMCFCFCRSSNWKLLAEIKLNVQKRTECKSTQIGSYSN